MEEKPFFVTLPDRGQLTFEGEDTFDFLQDIITNDIAPIKDGKLVYSCLLSAHGKFLHDFFVREVDGKVIFDCEGGQRTTDLFARFMMYRLRAKIKITKKDSVDAFVLMNTDHPDSYEDPRSDTLGRRYYGEKPAQLEEKSFDIWDQIRIKQGIPDGSRDMQIERSNIIESRLDKLAGVSFTKGCYVGQELTARLHNRGLSKRHLYAVELTDDRYQDDLSIKANEKTIGDIRSKNGSFAIALLKDAELDHVTEAGLTLIEKS